MDYRKMYKPGKFLNKDEEYELIKKVQENDDSESMQRLIDGNLKNIIKMSRAFFDKDANGFEEDIINESIIGFIIGVKKFDLSRDIRLWGYAKFWIRAYLNNIRYNKYTIVNHTSSSLAGKITKLLNIKDNDPSFIGMDNKKIRSTSEDLGVSDETVMRIINIKDHSLNRRFTKHLDSDNHSDLEFIDTIISEEKSPEDLLIEKDQERYIKDKVSKTFDKLSRRNQEIFIKRFNTDSEEGTLLNISNKFGISRERVRQIECMMLRKIKQDIELDCI